MYKTTITLLRDDGSETSATWSGTPDEQALQATVRQACGLAEGTAFSLVDPDDGAIMMLSADMPNGYRLRMQVLGGGAPIPPPALDDYDEYVPPPPPPAAMAPPEAAPAPFEELRELGAEPAVAPDVYARDKVRRPSSVSGGDKAFAGDQWHAGQDPKIMKMLKDKGEGLHANPPEKVLFSDGNSKKVNADGSATDRLLIVTNYAIYNVDSEGKLKLHRHIPIKSLLKLSVSCLDDNYLCVHEASDSKGGRKDLLMQTSAKTEVVDLLSNLHLELVDRELEVYKDNGFQYTAGKTENQILFTKVTGGVRVQIYEIKV